jgi:hypothetical protein
VTGRLPGFKTQALDGVVVESGATVTVTLVLELGCLDEVLYVDRGMAWAIQQADTIVHLRISASAEPKEWSFGENCLIGVEHTATVLQAAKSSPLGTASQNVVRFVTLRGDGRRYVKGQEYLALLRWEADAERYRPVSGFLYMFPVREGRVVWTRTDVPALKDQMPVADFIAALRSAF